MKVSDRALNFAIRANEEAFGKQKNEDIDIYKPIVVGDILKFYNFDDNVVAAGYLNGIVEDTEYTIDDISRMFGGEVACLVATSVEPNKDLSWNERKRQKIKSVKDLPYKNKSVIIASTIAKLEKYIMQNQMNGEIDFSDSEVDFETLKLYYQELFAAIDEGIEHPMLERLYETILNVFHNTDLDTDLKLSKSRININKKDELGNLKDVVCSKKPFIIEFTKQKRINRVKLMDLLDNFFKNDGYKLKVVNSDEANNKYKKDYITDKNCLNETERNYLIASEVEANLLTEVSNGDNIILIDQTLFARLIYLQRLLASERCSEENLEEFLSFHSPELEGIISYTVINYGERKTNKNSEYDKAMLDCMELLGGNSMGDNQKKVEMKVFENLLPIMQTGYIHQLKYLMESKKQ